MPNNPPAPGEDRPQAPADEPGSEPPAAPEGDPWRQIHHLPHIEPPPPEPPARRLRQYAFLGM